MQIFRYINSLIPKSHVWVIGNFDGLHKGHCALIEHAIDIATVKHKKVGIISFSPHPREYFNPNSPSIQIMQLSEKVHLLKNMNIDYYYLHPFNHITASMTAFEFCEKIQQQLLPSDIIVGYDFHFGKDRTGTPKTLTNFCVHHGIECTIIPPILNSDGVRYASQTIRKFLSEGNMSAVKSFLPHDYILSGRVQYGYQQASKLGFPTANIALKNIFLPKFGVYDCRIVNMDNRIAIANIGIKPTLYNNHSPLLEVHIPDFTGNLYGQKLRIAFNRFMRPEIKFSSFEELKNQIYTDMQSVYT
jgi:riboflavin kinase / FMN adenylyltransferase